MCEDARACKDGVSHQRMNQKGGKNGAAPSPERNQERKGAGVNSFHSWEQNEKKSRVESEIGRDPGCSVHG